MVLSLITVVLSIFAHLNQLCLDIMENQKGEFYKASGEYSSNGTFFTVFANLLFAIIGGYIYAVIIYYNPFVYANFLLSIGFGLSIGMLNRFSVRIAHNRNKKSQLILAGIGGFMALYVHWAIYFLIVDMGSAPSFGSVFTKIWWFINPANFFHSLYVINSYGLWSIFGITFKGFFLLMVWLMEAFIILFLSVSAVYKAVVFPYSEKLRMWYPKFTLDIDFQSIASAKKITEELKADSLLTIKEFKKGTANRYSKVHIYYLKEELNQYLSIENFFLENQGRGKKNGTIMISNLKINNESARTILETYRHKREKIDLI